MATIFEQKLSQQGLTEKEKKDNWKSILKQYQPGN